MLLFSRDRLIANDFIQVRKVAEHVYDKVLGAGSDSGSVAGGGNTVSSGSPAGDRTNTDSNADNSSLAEEKVELLCNDQVLDPSMDLRTVCIKLSELFVKSLRENILHVFFCFSGQTFHLEKFGGFNTSLSPC